MSSTPLTTKGLIDILPFEEEFKTDLKNKWDSLSMDQRNFISQLLWDTYADIYEARYDTNVEVALEQIAEGEETGFSLDKTFGKKIREKTQEELRKQATTAVSTATLSDTRKALESIMNTSDSQVSN